MDSEAQIDPLEVFVSALPEPHRDLWNTEVTRNTLVALCAAGAGAWPTIRLQQDTFLRHLAASVEPSDVTTISDIRDGDLYLACACGHGDVAALKAFEEGEIPGVMRTLQSMKVTTDCLDDVVQVIRYRLLIGSATRGPRILNYRGRSTLGRWLRVITVREALEVLKKPSQAVSLEALEFAIPAIGASPEYSRLRAEFGPQVKAALSQGVKGLASRERALLRMHAVEGLGHEQIARIYSVHRTTVLRWLEKAQAELILSVRAYLQEHLKISEEEFFQVMASLVSQLTLSLATLLVTTNPESPDAT